MKYMVVVSNYWVGKVKHKRGDIVEMTEEEFNRHGTKLQPYAEPPKAKRKSKAKPAKISGDPSMDIQISGVENEEI